MRFRTDVFAGNSISFAVSSLMVEAALSREVTSISSKKIDGSNGVLGRVLKVKLGWLFHGSG